MLCLAVEHYIAMQVAGYVKEYVTICDQRKNTKLHIWASFIFNKDFILVRVAIDLESVPGCEAGTDSSLDTSPS